MHLIGIGLNCWTNPQGGSQSFFIPRHGPGIYRSPKKNNQEFQAPLINIWNFSNPKNILHSVPWPSEKTLKCIEMTSKYSPILWWLQKNIHKIFIPPKIISFLKDPKIIEIQNFEPKKNSPGLHMYEKIWVTPLGEKQTDGQRISLLLKSEISNSSFCFTPLMKVHAN